MLNLKDAAETMRRYYDPKDPFDGPCGSAPDVLQMAALSWLDPSPITEDLLRKNDWECGMLGFWSKKNNGEKIEIRRRVDEEGWVVSSRYLNIPIHTIGELLRLLSL